MADYRRIGYKKLDVLKNMDAGKIEQVGVDTKTLEGEGFDPEKIMEIQELMYADYKKRGHKITDGSASDLTDADIKYIKMITPKEYWQ
ncbi:MAG: hypothetical protein JXB14_03230 [Candidatus Altiarchaeota archaeon]|nr:hypothetical protein [Candidatus Altiarchaeota archaeon]